MSGAEGSPFNRTLFELLIKSNKRSETITLIGNNEDSVSKGAALIIPNWRRSGGDIWGWRDAIKLAAFSDMAQMNLTL